MAGGFLAGGGRFHRSSFSGAGLVLDGARPRCRANLIRIACPVPYLHARIAVGRMSKRHPITVIPPVASLPGNRVISSVVLMLSAALHGGTQAALEWLG